MNREQRRAASKIRKNATHSIPKISANPVSVRPRFHFWLGLATIVRSPIESLKALGMFAEMSKRGV